MKKGKSLNVFASIRIATIVLAFVAGMSQYTYAQVSYSAQRIPAPYQQVVKGYKTGDNGVDVPVNVKPPYPCQQAVLGKNGEVIQSPCHRVVNGKIVDETLPVVDVPVQPVSDNQIGADGKTLVALVKILPEVPCSQEKVDAEKLMQAELQKAPCPYATTQVVQNIPSKCAKNPELAAIDPECIGVKRAESMNIETPDRCQIPLNVDLVSNLPFNQNDFRLVAIDGSDDLPRYEVNDYTFSNWPLDTAIQNLVAEAGIKVYSDDALFPEVSGDKIRGELSAVINELANTADAFYSYDAQKKQFVLSRWGRFALKVPAGRVGMYVILDALRGSNITNIQPDFGTNEIYMTLNKENYKTVSKLLETIKERPEFVLFDIRVLRFIKNDKCPVDWQKLIEKFGVKKVNASVSGIQGRILTMKEQPSQSHLTDALRPYGTLNLISEGTAVMPDGWRVRFDIGQCTRFETPEDKLSMLFQSSVVKGNRLESNIALDTPAGEISAFHTFYNVGDSLNIIGVTGKAFEPSWNDNMEYIIVLTPRLLRLVK